MKTKTAKEWNEKAQAYSKMASSKEADAFEYEVNFPSILKLCPEDINSILDLGCGDGGFTQILNKRAKTTGADVSPEMIKLARSKYPEIDFTILDLEQEFPSFVTKFDLVVIKLVLMFVEDLDNAASNISRVLRPGGYVVFSVTHPLYWTNYYLQDRYHYKDNPNFRVLTRGYFSERAIEKSIGGDKELVFNFIHRTFSSYINTFSKHGLLVDEIDEPQLPPDFIAQHSEYQDKQDIPMRLNIRFKKNW